MASRLESIPKPICERTECERTATVQVVTDVDAESVYARRYCSAHGMSALRQAEGQETPQRGLEIKRVKGVVAS